ncbi:hypothetical protein [Aeromonas veronii]
MGKATATTEIYTTLKSSAASDVYTTQGEGEEDGRIAIPAALQSYMGGPG